MPKCLLSKGSAVKKTPKKPSKLPDSIEASRLFFFFLEGADIVTMCQTDSWQHLKCTWLRQSCRAPPGIWRLLKGALQQFMPSCWPFLIGPGQRGNNTSPELKRLIRMSVERSEMPIVQTVVSKHLPFANI